MTGAGTPLDGLRSPPVVVRDRAPLLPKVAFALIAIASLLGTALSNRGLGIPTGLLLPRWLALWAAAAALGFLLWRVAYLRDREAEVPTDELVDYHVATLARATLVGRALAAVIALTVPVGAMADHLASRPEVRLLLAVAASMLVTTLVIGPRRRSVGSVGLVAAGAALVVWAIGDAGTGVAGVWRGLHLVAFGLWVGGALWNLSVAIPVGVRHPTIAAVTSGAHQLQRFRRVARVSLPTVVVTGVLMAHPYLADVSDLVATVPGRFITAKAGLIVLLVVIFITCPLYRQCSPVAGVCDLDDRDDAVRPGRRR